MSQLIVSDNFFLVSRNVDNSVKQVLTLIAPYVRMVFNGLPDNVLVKQDNRLKVSAHYVITKNVIVVNRKRLTLPELLPIILHETYHCHQVFRGDLSWSRRDWSVLWKGHPVTGQHHELPWEVEVHGEEQRLCEELISRLPKKVVDTLFNLVYDKNVKDNN